ncbi:hypothetical protein E2320_012950 [Naja naja]|nr:hypothetical protein E2320_012950 [Naja naja]
MANPHPANLHASRCVSQAKQEARNGNLEASLQLFQQALKIHFSEKLTTKINKLEEALASLPVEEEEDDNFVDVCQSGFMLYGEMHDKLFDYQREGVAFLYRLYRDRRKGGILADDMGLGKTIQIIAFLSGMFDAELIRSVLLILPATLLSNWAKEFAKWTPGLRVKVFHGTNKAERNRYLKRIQSRKGILLTTYQMLLNNWQQLSSFGGKEFVWDYIILDEAHKIKTPSAKTTKSLHAIPSKNRILLTGTPVQNNLKELWTLFDFACQGSLLGTMKTFRMEYETPITRARAKDATPGEKALGLKISENLMSIIKPYFLRRTKDELQQKKKLEHPNHLPENQSEGVAPVMPSLPRKNEFIVWVFLAPVQEEIYRNFISLEHIKELLLSTRSPLAELNILKKLCDHPRLLSNRACSQLGLEASNYSEEAVGENEPSELPDMKRSIEHVSDEMLIQESGKLSVLVGLLERLQYEGHRTLVFSLSRKMLDIIERVLTHRGFKLMRIDGTVTQLAEREKRIGMFQKGADYSVFLLTTQVGGTGLTLTAASRVVIFDPSWNPATDAQAADRAYRIGQKENVIIYRLISCATVEEKIYRRQVFKDSLIRQSTGDEKNPFRYFTMQELKELFILEDTRRSATQLQLQSLHATQRKTDTELDEHIAYLHMLDIFGISDHDLMYTRETAHNDEAKNEEAHRYIEHRVKKAQELVQLESQLNDQHIRNIGNLTEGAWLRDTDSSTQPKTKPSKSSPGDTLGPSTSKRTNPTVVESPTPSKKKSPNPPPSPVLTPPVFIRPVISNEVIDLVSDDDNDAVSDMVNLSSKMTSLVAEDVDDEQMLHIISITEYALPSEEKEHQFPSFQACDLNPGTTLVSPFQTQSVSVKEDYSPESRTISEVPAKDTDDEQMLSRTTNMDVLHSKEYQPTRLQTDDQNENLNVLSSVPQATSSSIKGSVNSESKMISCDPSPEARSDLKDVQMKLLKESVAYPSDNGMHRTQSDMSLDVLPISHKDTWEINEVDAVAQHQALISKTTKGIALQNSGTTETAQFRSPDIFSQYLQMRNIGNTTKEAWLRDTDSSTQPKRKPSKSSPGDTLGPSTSKRTNPTVVESPTPSKRNHQILLQVLCLPHLPVISNEVIDLVSDDDNDAVSDMVNLSSKMTSLVAEDVDDEQMLHIISITEYALPSEEKEHQFPSFQACDLNPGTTLVSPFQTQSVSVKEDYSPESRAISEVPAKDTDDEQMLSHTTDMDVLHSKNEEYQPTRLQTDDQSESLNVVSSLPLAISSLIKGSVNSESKMISCDPSPEARSDLKDVQMKLLKESVAYPSDNGMHRTQSDMSLDVLPISHKDTWEINEVDAVAQHQALISKTSKGIALQNSGTTETAQFRSPDIFSQYLQMRNIGNTTKEAWLRDTDSSTQPKRKPSKSSPGDTHGPSTSKRTNPTVVESPTPSKKKSPNPPPSPVLTPPVFIRPVISNEVIDVVSDDDNDAVSDMVNLSSKMTSLVAEDTQSVSVKEDYSPESRAISEVPAKDTDDEQMLSHTTDMDVLHSKNEEYQPTRLQTDDQSESLNVVSSLPLAISSLIKGSVNSESKMISCDPSPEARSDLKDVQMKLLKESVAYPSDNGMHRTQSDMSLDVLPISHKDTWEINEVDAVAQHQALISKTTKGIALQNSGTTETAQFRSPDIFSQYLQMRNIGNTTKEAWLRDTDSSTQPKRKPSKSSPGDTLGPSTSKQTNPTVMESSTPSTKKSPTLPDPVLTPPVFIRPVTTNEVIDLVSDDDNDAVSDMVSLSSKMTSLVVEDMDDEEMFHIISNTEDGLPSEEKEHQFPSFQACDLNPGTTLVSPFQTQSVSVKEDYSPESRAISEVPAKDTDDEQMLSRTTNMDVLHSKEYQPTRLQTDDQNENLNVLSSVPQATSSSIKGSVNSESKMISCDPSPEARSDLKDVQMKLLKESVAYPSDNGMHRTQSDMSLDVLPISHKDTWEINEVDAVAQHQALISKTSKGIALQNSGTTETAQFRSPDIFSQYLQMRNIGNTTKEAWLRDTDSSTQPKRKPSKSSPGDTHGPSTSKRTNPTVVESPTPSKKKSPNPPPSPVLTPPVFIRPVITNEVIDLVSDDDNDTVNDMVKLSSKMSSLVLEDMDDEQMLPYYF